ncbi:hypothetical protein F5Y12DRAFT_196961 [Xylaria sp. FL1777]|nr:hypothetical protein F5Y12DRAFT_196961 [Xylaria sp. FL1777]
MDPISALSLACNIIDLVSKAVKGVVTVVEVYKSADGRSIANEIISREADSIRDIVADLQHCQSQPAYSTADQKIREISKTSISRCVELQSVLDGCRSSQKRGILSASNACLKILVRKGKIEQLQNDIVSSRDELFRWFAASTRAGVSDTLKRLEDMSKTNCEIQKTLQTVNDRLLLVLGSTDSQKENGATACLEEIRQILIDRVILQLLYFPDIGSRFEDVVTQDEGTFEWIFTDPGAVRKNEPQLATTFPAWLESGDGIFHICGKPGSGKSTLMKYICRNPTTDDLLGKWSGDNELVVARFFFWRIGVDGQKTIKGLIRGLLHQILCSVPKLSRRIFTKKTRDRLFDGLQKHSNAGLDVGEITEALLRLVAISTSSNPSQDLQGIRICLFIDGLDEFDTAQINQTYRELVGKLCRWTEDSDGHIKICVSSRIQEPFMKMFDESKRFTLHRLTKGDIELFIKQSLESHSEFQTHLRKSPAECRDLIRNVRQSADGVFLWVALVLKELEAGLDDGFPIKRLQEIVSETPGDVDLLLKQIITSINKPSRRGVEVLLSAMLRATGMLLSHRDIVPECVNMEGSDDFHLSALSAFFLLRATDMRVSMQEDVVTSAFQFEREEWFRGGTTDTDIMKAISGIVRTRCKGLIDIDGRDGHKIAKFMHRSVPEFLQTYFSHASASHSDHSSTLAMSWAFLVDSKWFVAKNIERSSLFSFLSGTSVSRPCEDARLVTRAFSVFPFEILARIRQLKLGDEWEDVFQILFLIQKACSTHSGAIFFIVDCGSQGLHEFIAWLIRKTDFLAQETFLFDVMDGLSLLRFEPSSANNRIARFRLAAMETAFSPCIDGHIPFPPQLFRKPGGKHLWHSLLLCVRIGAIEERLEGSQVYRETQAIHATMIELWLRHGANAQVYFRLSEDGRKCIGISSAPDNSGYISCHESAIENYRVLLGLQRKDKREFSLRDAVLHWKPPNVSILLELLKDNAKNECPEAQNPTTTKSNPSEIGNNRDKENWSVVQPSQWLYIHLAYIGVLGFIIAYFIQYIA